MSDYASKIKFIRENIKSYPDFPKKGILFRDIFSALAKGPVCVALKDVVVNYVKTHFPGVECIVGLEARGFLFSLMIAAELGIGCVPIRKKGKLPGEIASVTYKLEYGEDIFEMQKDSVQCGQKVLIIDDLIATGGSLCAAVDLLKIAKAGDINCLVIMELGELKGRDKVPVPVHSLIQYCD